MANYVVAIPDHNLARAVNAVRELGGRVDPEYDQIGLGNNISGTTGFALSASGLDILEQIVAMAELNDGAATRDWSSLSISEKDRLLVFAANSSSWILDGVVDDSDDDKFQEEIVPIITGAPQAAQEAERGTAAAK